MGAADDSEAQVEVGGVGALERRVELAATGPVRKNCGSASGVFSVAKAGARRGDRGGEGSLPDFTREGASRSVWVQSSLRVLRFARPRCCGFTQTDLLAPSHAKAVNRASGGSGFVRGCRWMRCLSRAACGRTGRKMPDPLAALPAADPIRGRLDVRVREDRVRGCLDVRGGCCGNAAERFAVGWTSVSAKGRVCVVRGRAWGLSRGTDSELAVRSPRLSSGRGVLRGLDRVSGTGTRRPISRRVPVSRGCARKHRRTSEWMWRARSGRHLRAHIVRVARRHVRGGSAAGTGSRVSSILRPTAAASCSTRASRITTRSRIHQSRRQRASGGFRAWVRGGRWT